MTIPNFESARLRFRAHAPNDFASCAKLWADPIVTRYITGQPLSAEDVWARLLRYAGHWCWLEYGYWAVEEKATGLFVGEIGFADYKRDLQPSITGAPELGYVLASPFHGKGYASEAVTAAVAWADSRFGGARTVCLVNPANAASLRVAHKCGYREFARSFYKGEPAVLLERFGTR